MLGKKNRVFTDNLANIYENFIQFKNKFLIHYIFFMSLKIGLLIACINNCDKKKKTLFCYNGHSNS